MITIVKCCGERRLKDDELGEFMKALRECEVPLDRKERQLLKKLFITMIRFKEGGVQA